MIGELGDLRSRFAADRSLQRAVVEKRDMLRPRQPHHDAQSVAGGLVEQIASRWRVRTNGVDAESRHEAEVFGNLLR